MSFIDGGADIVIEYKSGSVYGYDWVKKPGLYVKAIISRKINYFENSTNPSSEAYKLKLIKNVINRIYAREFEKSTFYSARYKLCWDNNSQILPWDSFSANKTKIDLDFFVSDVEDLSDYIAYVIYLKLAGEFAFE